MSIKKLVIVIGLCVLFTGCSTGRYSGSEMLATYNLTPTEKGMRYLLGRGVQKNNETAFYYLSKAANDGDPFAQNELAYLYASGKGTKRDYGKSIIWYKKAASHGLASAEYNLGLLYLRGLGTKADKKAAIEWFQKSSDHGFEPARLALAKYRS